MQNYRKYLNISSIEQEWGFHIKTVGSAKLAPNKNYPNNNAHPMDHSFTWDKGHILDGYYLVFITRGEGVLKSAKTKAHTIKAGTCFFIPRCVA
jgi:hypothetical protein